MCLTLRAMGSSDKMPLRQSDSDVFIERPGLLPLYMNREMDRVMSFHFLSWSKTALQMSNMN